jgi:uncharacterized lipoprotein
MRNAVLIILLALGGCGLFKPTFESCEETPAYADAREVPPLQVPEGTDVPDTRNALKVPPVTTPEKPRDGKCIDVPPSFVPNQPGTGS